MPLRVVELGDGRDLVSQFDDGAVAFAGIEAGVGGNTFHFQRIFPYALALGFESATESGCRFEHEDGRGLSGQAFGDGARGAAADFFVRHEKNSNRAWKVSMPSFQGGDGLHHEDDTGLHVERAGTVETIAGNAAQHGGEGAEGIDGVEMPQQQHGRTVAASGETDLEMVGVGFGAVDVGFAAHAAKFFCQKSAEAVAGRLVIAGGLDLYQFADGFDHFFLLSLEIAQAVGGGGVFRRPIFLDVCRLLARHCPSFVSRFGCRVMSFGLHERRRNRSGLQYNLQAVPGEL